LEIVRSDSYLHFSKGFESCGWRLVNGWYRFSFFLVFGPYLVLKYPLLLVMAGWDLFSFMIYFSVEVWVAWALWESFFCSEMFKSYGSLGVSYVL